MAAETVALNPIDARYSEAKCRVLLTGVQALARLPLEQARRDRAKGLHTAAYISGYEGSPLGGYDLELARQQKLLDEHHVRFEPGLNEELAATAVQGTQLIYQLTPKVEGVVGYWYGKAPGLDRASDALRHANLMGTHPQGGAVAFVGDDPAAKSSSLPCASEHALADLMMPIFAPSDAADVLNLGRHAIAMSRASGLWSSIKIVTAVADGSVDVDLEAGDDFDPVIPFGAGLHEPTAKLLQPNLGPLERDMLSTRMRIAKDYIALNNVNRTIARSPDDRIGIVTSGAAYLEVMHALDKLGFGEHGENASTVRVLKLGVIWPIDRGQLNEFAAGLDRIIVVEEKRSFIEAQLREALYGAAHQPLVVGKQDENEHDLFAAFGELGADLVTRSLAKQLLVLPDAPGIARWQNEQGITRGGRKMLPLAAARTPYYCSGCPHNTSTRPHTDSVFGGGIGCHSMVLLMDSKQVGDVTGLTQMGGEGAQWIGMAPFIENRHLVQNLGDGTFHHSGSLAIRASVAAKTNITYRILYNSTVAMTGGQDAVGQMQVTEMARALLAEGVQRIIVTSDDPRTLKKTRLPERVDIWPRSRIDEAQEVLAAISGTTVLIHEQECATELRRKRKRGLRPMPTEYVMINERICEGCGDCGEKSNCLSVQPIATEFGRKTQIHQSSCNVDLSCLAGECPAFVTVRPGKSGRQHTMTQTLSADELADPPVSNKRSHRVRLMGVGGTGVVTTSQLLATAAVLSGRYVRTLDRTGLAQKGGAVVSDVAIETAPFKAGASSGEASCDLYLGYDLLVAADAMNLQGLSPEATALVSTSIVPTGAMVSNPEVSYPDTGEVLARIQNHSPDVRCIDLDLRRFAETLFDSEQFGNLFMLGIAVQMGVLNLPAEAFEEAIGLNRVAVEANVQAFRRGRQYIADRNALEAYVRELERNPDKKPLLPSKVVRAELGSELERLVAIRRHDLVRYQNERYARRYEAVVERVREAEVVSHMSGEHFGRPPGTPLAEAVARNLYKLMAYKDEYEVARLALDSTMSEAVKQQFGSDARVNWRLHPPTLRSLGLKQKISLGPWFRPAFVVLRAARGLRGTVLDPFAFDRVRKLERELLREYEQIVQELVAKPSITNSPIALLIADLPDLIRGYDSVKLKNVARYRVKLDELRAALAAV